MQTCLRRNGKVATLSQVCQRRQQSTVCQQLVQTSIQNSNRRVWQCQKPRTAQIQLRHASTRTTIAGLNGQKTIPPANVPLYQALKEVQQKVAAHISVSRLQLALQGLETTQPTTRLALLGLDGDEVVRRTVRLLLADPLEDEQPWERKILEQEAANGFIIRYGPTQNPNVPHRTTIQVLTIPSPTLQKLNVELLVGSVNNQHGFDALVPVETFLAPAVAVPTSSDGRTVTVNQPVHAALLLGDGFDGMVSTIQLLSQTNFESSGDKKLITLAACIPGLESTNQTVRVCDLDKAAHGLDAIRSSTANGAIYGREWTASGLPQLSQWLTDNAVSATNIVNLTTSILDSANVSLERSMASLPTVKTNDLDVAIKYQLNDVVDSFSRFAHRDLQAGLASAWASRSWSKLSWYKLFWRIDDVGLITSDLVSNMWLRETEKNAYEICGRFLQLGINPVVQVEQNEIEIIEEITPANVEQQAAYSLQSDSSATQAAQPILSATKTQEFLIVEPKTTTSTTTLANSISLARKDYVSRQVENLSSTAQQLLFRTLSISGLSGGLSALVYVSGIAPTVFEAGSLFALGTVVALWRLQSGWQSATKAMEKDLFEEGRTVVRQLVAQMRTLVDSKETAIPPEMDVDTQLIVEAKQAVDKARQEVDALLGSKQDS